MSRSASDVVVADINEATAGGGEAPEAGLRPLETLVPDDLGAYVSPELRLPDLVEAPSFESVKAYFADYPKVGLSTPTGRSLMFHIVRAMRPELVIEIGTYHAGMTEIIAQALWENDSGRIVTIDPFGGARVPQIVQAWPEALNRHVSFANFTSMDLYMDFEQVKRPFDLAFIDGNHAYEFAYYDLISLAKWIRPGGVILVDDPYQPGVFWAVKHFLERFPGWRELGGALQDWRPSDPFGSIRGSVVDSNFLILAAPPDLALSDCAVSFESQPFAEIGLSGLELRLAPGNERGFLHALVFLRSFGIGDNITRPDQQMATAKIMLDADVDRRLLIPVEPMRTTHDRATSQRKAEIVLFWQCAEGNQPLRLESVPRPILVD